MLPVEVASSRSSVSSRDLSRRLFSLQRKIITFTMQTYMQANIVKCFLQPDTLCAHALMDVPCFLDESFSVLLQFFLLKANDDTQELVLQSLHSHSVIDDHCSTKYCRSVLGIGKLGVQVEPGKSKLENLHYPQTGALT